MLIRTYQTGDEKHIWELDRQLEEHPWNRRELSNWHWKYTDQNPAGRSYIWMMEEKGRLIAHFAAVPYPFKVFEKTVTASHTIGALVAQDYQNRGILKFVADKLFEELQREKIPFTYGFPNKRAYLLQKTFFGYHDLLFFDAWRVGAGEISPIAVDKDFKAIEKFGDDVDELWTACEKDYRVAVVRNQGYLNWRYLQRPDAKYYPFGLYRNGTLKGYAILKLYREAELFRGHIIDIFAGKHDEETLARLVDGSLDFLRRQKVQEVTCWFWGNPVCERIFQDKGFVQQGTRIPLILRINEDFPEAEQVRDSGNWYFTMGDSTEIF